MAMHHRAIGLAAPSMIAAPAAAEPFDGRQRADPHNPARSRSKYMPHQGEREIARRLRQQARKDAR